VSSTPAHSVEIERKYEVDAATRLPDFTALPGVVHVDAPELRELDGQYYDTADLALARVRVAVRRRTGGPDEGWHVKAAAADGKHEWHWPLGEGHDVPADVAAILAEWTGGPFLPLARIRNRRTAYALRDAGGGVVAEFVDDCVRARNDRAGSESSWREWELELGPAAPVDHDAFFAAADALVAAVGGRVAASDSKLARALSV